MTLLALVACGDDDGSTTATTAGGATTTAGGTGTTAAGSAEVPAELADMYAFAQAETPNVTLDVLQAACDEGEVSVSLPNLPEGELIKDEFEKVFPCITADVVVLADDDSLARFLAGVDAGDPLDIYSNGSEITMRDQVFAEDLLAEYTPSGADQFPNVVEPGYFYPLAFVAQGVVYNTGSITPDMVEPIKTWKDVALMTGPAWEGKKLGMVDPHGAGGGSYVVAYVLYKELGADKLAEVLNYLEVTVYEGSGAAVDALVAGELDVLLANDLNALRAHDEGAPVQVHYPEPRSGTRSVMGIVKGATHPNAAILFEEYILSKPGQMLFPEHFGTQAARSEVPDTRPSAQEDWYVDPVEYYEFDLDDMAAAYEQVVAPFPNA